MAIAAGSLTERITLQKAAVTRNSIGEEVAGWTDIITDLPAAVRWLKGSRALTFGDVWNPATVKITCRYREAFEEAERILWHGKEFTVVSAFGDRVNMNLTITADLYHEGKNADEPDTPVPVYLTAWKIVGNSEVHTDSSLTSWKVSGNSVVQDGSIMSCGDLGQDGKYHVKISNGVNIYDIPLTEPLRKVNNVADTIEFPSDTDGKALVIRNFSKANLGNFSWLSRSTKEAGKTRYSTSTNKEVLPNCIGSARSGGKAAIALCSKYNILSPGSTYRHSEGIEIFDSSNVSDGQILIYDSNANTLRPSDFKNYLQGVELIYQIIPTTELVDAPQIAVSPTNTYTSANVVSYSAFEHTENKEIWSCGEYSETDSKYHVVVLPTGKQTVDIVLDKPLRKVNDIADTLEYPLGISGKALLTTRVAEIDGELTPLVTPTIALVDVPQIEESTEYSNVITPGSKAVEWSEFGDPEETT